VALGAITSGCVGATVDVAGAQAANRTATRTRLRRKRNTERSRSIVIDFL
jgi:hypothetical protein